ncbi:hypothetical protein [Bacillus cereus group sp. BfR-BA-01315]|uniref:hypothetical protein n=1 Tax=Bacillus cereus group sp. BfR-BA-01315 TaxID=2920292 RepID=UPI001F58E062|nr:hypothetical protein [Bacillus cereus group sp. BfR-BA-01315]
MIQLQKAQQSNGSIFEFQEDEETGDSLEQVTVPQFEENVTESESTKEPEKKKVVRESLF